MGREQILGFTDLTGIYWKERKEYCKSLIYIKNGGQNTPGGACHWERLDEFALCYRDYLKLPVDCRSLFE